MDPVSLTTQPGLVDHRQDGDAVTTRLASSTIAFEATLDTTDATERALHLDWIEAGDDTCHRSGVCDRYYYDAEHLDVPANVPANVTVDELSTPWDAFIDSSPATVFFRDNFQQYAIKPWYNLDVAIESLPFTGVDNPTHSLSGTGSLQGRDTSLVNSEYSYSGDARLEGDVLFFALDQQITNAVGTANVFTTGQFDLTTASGTQTVVDCDGNGLLCTGIESGSTNFYTAQELDPTDLDAISWEINAAIDLGGSFCFADSASTIVASAESDG